LYANSISLKEIVIPISVLNDGEYEIQNGLIGVKRGYSS
jgi:hypothetical protein